VPEQSGKCPWGAKKMPERSDKCPWGTNKYYALRHSGMTVCFDGYRLRARQYDGAL